MHANVSFRQLILSPLSARKFVTLLHEVRSSRPNTCCNRLIPAVEGNLQGDYIILYQTSSISIPKASPPSQGGGKRVQSCRRPFGCA